MVKKFFVTLVLTLLNVAAVTKGGDPVPSDSRLGTPFGQRERAVLGSDTARVVVVEFSSFRCAHCQTFHQEVFPILRRQFVDPGKVQWVIINASNEASDQTAPVFLAARGAVHQGCYWQIVDQLYQAGSEPPAFLRRLLVSTRREDMSLEGSLLDPAVRAAVATDFGEYAKLGIRGTPTFLLRKLNRDGRWTKTILEDLQSIDYFTRVLNGLLEQP